MKASHFAFKIDCSAVTLYKNTHLSFSTDTILRYIWDLLAQEKVILEIFREEVSLEIKLYIIFHIFKIPFNQFKAY